MSSKILNEELALKYIIGNINNEEKIKVFNLLTNDSEFRDILIKEKELYKQMQNLSISLDKNKCEEIFKNIMREVNQREEDNLSLEVIKVILENVLPKFSIDIINYFKKERFVYEI